LGTQRLKSEISSFYNNKFDESIVDRVLPLVFERMKLLTEFESLAGFFFQAPEEYERIPETHNLKLLRTALAECKWSHAEMEAAIRDMSVKAGRKSRDVFMDLRIAVTGKTVGPPLLESLEILGKEETLNRLRIQVITPNNPSSEGRSRP
jgi:glutamyl/glutaminyl-tRNA synthetase